jgi:hypothetical protein
MTVIPGALADTEALARLVDLRVRAARTLGEAANL